MSFAELDHSRTRSGAQLGLRADDCDGLSVGSWPSSKLSADPRDHSEPAERRLSDVHDALFAVSPDLHHDDWVRIAMAAKSAGLAFEAFDDWSKGGQSYNKQAVAATWKSIDGQRGISAGTLFYMARQEGWRPKSRRQVRRVDQPHLRHAPVRHLVAERQAPLPLSRREVARWNEFQPIDGPALAYLHARQCVIPPIDGNLRFNPAQRHWPTGYVGPALIALVTDVRTNEPISFHYTWIDPTGEKAKISRPRLLLGGHRKHGGVIRLWPDDAVTTGLAVAEGIETALSMAHAYKPVWACIDAGNLAAFPVLDGIECLVIGADHDVSGIKGANTCAQRWAQAGRDARIVLPQEQGTDLNDVARASS